MQNPVVYRSQSEQKKERGKKKRRYGLQKTHLLRVGIYIARSAKTRPCFSPFGEIRPGPLLEIILQVFGDFFTFLWRKAVRTVMS